jgi:RimJ/RimL family protein N-acetyltransferase
VGTIRVGADGAVIIIIDSVFRGQGYGPTMLEAVAPLAKEAGLRTLLAEVAPENVRSQRCFVKAGWVPVLFERPL